MSNVIQFPQTIKRQVVDTAEQAEEYAELWLANDKYVTANILPFDDKYIVTVYPADELMRKAVENNQREYSHVF